MCGISGFLHFDKGRIADRGILNKMNNALVHRGPDGEGDYTEKNLALGHRRLSIIDIAGGKQPMLSTDGKVVIVFNGEIYNYIELKSELITLGCRFETNSDTEVIINAYQTWGADCMNRFNGMWAFALWDANKEVLILSRDRIGEKPLYYSIYDNSLIFGSEIKAVTAYGVPQRPRYEMAELYLTLSFVPAPYTFYKDILQLEPGKFIRADKENIKINTYWRLPDITDADLVKDVKQVENQFEQLFDDSVRIRMRSDVSFGAFLSGGLDSSCVVGTMARHATYPVKTFTIGFDDKKFDERHLARLVSRKYNTEHFEGTVTPENLFSALDAVLRNYDDPFGDSSAIPTGQISKYASQHVKMVLIGDGGDETLAGYTRFQIGFPEYYQLLPGLIRKKLPDLVKVLSKPVSGGLKYKMNRIAKILESSNYPFDQRLLYRISRTTPESLSETISTQSAPITFKDFYHEIMKECRFKDPFYKLMYFQQKVTLPGDMLVKVDRMSMAHSIETRAPFLDYRLIELLFGVHKKVKSRGGKTKAILRNTVARKLLPQELLTAPKRGFTIPLREWFKKDDLSNEIRDILLENDNNPIYNTQAVEQLIQQNKDGKADVGNFLWMVLVMKKWLDLNSEPV